MSKGNIKKLAAFTIVELLISLALMGMLLAAVAVAFNASAMNYQANERMFKTLNAARQTLQHITTRIRTADAVPINEAANQCSFITITDGEIIDDITYRYDSGSGNVYLVTNDDLTDSDYLLCSNVTAMTFTKTIATDDEGVDYVENVQISITITDAGGDSQTISTSVTVRKNL